MDFAHGIQRFRDAVGQEIEPDQGMSQLAMVGLQCEEDGAMARGVVEALAGFGQARRFETQFDLFRMASKKRLEGLQRFGETLVVLQGADERFQRTPVVGIQHDRLTEGLTSRLPVCVGIALRAALQQDALGVECHCSGLTRLVLR